MEGRAYPGGLGAMHGAETAVQERSFDVFLQRLSSANGSLAEARARLGAFNDRLSGQQPTPLSGHTANQAPPTPRPENVEARLLAVIDQFELQVNELHSQIGRLERSA